MKNKKLLSLLLTLSLAISLFLVGCGSSPSSTSSPAPTPTPSANDAPTSSDAPAGTAETINLKVGHVAPPNHSYTIGLEEYAQMVSEATNGQVQIEIFGGGQLGGERDLTEQIQLGTLDMGLITSGPVGNFLPELSVLEMPFIFRDVEHVYKTLDGEIGMELLTKLEGAGFKALGFWENGFRHLSNNKKEIRTPEDMKGLKMRTIENDIFVETYRALGTDPTPIAWPETYTSLQQGVIDGFDASYGVFDSSNMDEVQDQFTEAGIYYASAILLINLEQFNSYPAEIQDALLLGREYATKQREINQKMESEQKENMLANGVNIIDSQDVDLAAFREAVQVIYDNHSNRFGDYVERIQAVQ